MAQFEKGNKCGALSKGKARNRRPRAYYELMAMGRDTLTTKGRILSKTEMALIPRILLTLSKDELMGYMNCGVNYVERMAEILVGNDLKSYFSVLKFAHENATTCSFGGWETDDVDYGYDVLNDTDTEQSNDQPSD